MAKKEELDALLKERFQQCQYNTPGMVCVARQMKKCAIKAAEDAEAILQYANVLEQLQADQEAEMEMLGYISE